MLARLITLLGKGNSTLGGLSWIWWFLLVAFPTAPTALVGYLAASRDDFVATHGVLGVVVLMVIVFTAICLALGGVGLFAISRAPRPPEPTIEQSPALPVHTLLAVQVVERIGKYLEERGRRVSRDNLRALVSSFYDALRSEHVKCWGHKSNYYPPNTKAPHAPREFIDPAFWTSNTIEEIDLLASNEKPTTTKLGWNIISMPDPDRFTNRALVVCYWDIVFDRDDVRRKWPLKNDWQST